MNPDNESSQPVSASQTAGGADGKDNGAQARARLQGLGTKFVVGMLLAVLVYGAFVMVGGYQKLGDELSKFRWSALAIACGLSFGNYLLRFAKWEYYLAIIGVTHVPKFESFLTFLSGFVLTITPGKVGEVFESIVLWETRAVPITRSAPIVVAERVTDLTGVIALIAVGSLTLPGGLIWMAAGSSVVIGVLAFVSSTRLSNAVLDWIARLGGPFGRAVPKVQESLLSLRYLVAPRKLVIPTALSLVGWGLEGVGVWVLLTGFGTDASLPGAAFSYGTATLAGALVPVPGGLGVAEKVLEETMMSAAGVAPDRARAAMLLARFATLWFAVFIGFVALGLLKRRFPHLLKRGS